MRGSRPERPDRAGRWLEEAEHQPDRGGLAGAVRAQQGDGLAPADGEAAVVEGERAAEAAGDAVELDGGEWDVNGSRRVR